MDRNLWWGVRKAVGSLSLSARRAWIEIGRSLRQLQFALSLSARRAWIEIDTGTYHPHFHVSLSARRAWIEITGRSVEFNLFAVALRKESVDRNKNFLEGLKDEQKSLSARRAWIEICPGRI